MSKKKSIKKQTAKLTHKTDKKPVTIEVDDSARLKEITKLVVKNNQSVLSTELVVCQIYFESRFDKNAGKGRDARGLMQMQLNAVKQVYKYRVQKKIGHMPSDKQTAEAFAEGKIMHSSELIFDESTNIQLGTEYLQYFINETSTIEKAYISYRGVSNGIYYRKIKMGAEKLKLVPNSMQVLLDMVK